VTRLTRVGAAFAGLALVVVVLGLWVLRLPGWIVLILAIVLLAVNFGVSYLVLRSEREAMRRVVAAHPDAFAMATAVVAWASGDPAARRRVVALVADRSGISLRDRSDQEVALLPADEILSIDLAPLTRTAFRPFRVATAGHGTLDLAMSQVRPDDQVDAVVALRGALGRAS